MIISYLNDLTIVVKLCSTSNKILLNQIVFQLSKSFNRLHADASVLSSWRTKAFAADFTMEILRTYPLVHSYAGVSHDENIDGSKGTNP